MLRAIVLSLALLIGLGTLLPLATEMAEAGPRKKRKYKKKKGVKRYSKRWWQLRRKKARKRRAKARQKRTRKLRRARLTRKRRLVRKRRVRLARKRRLAKKRRVRLAKKRRYTKRRRAATATAKKRRYTKRRRATTARKRRTTPRQAVVNQTSPTQRSYTSRIIPKQTPQYSAPTVLPTDKTAPKGWISKGLDQGEVQFNVQDERSGSQIGSASISVVGQAVENNRVINSRVKTVGGVTTTALRRTIIDQMIREEGWVVNDYQKEINGQKVYVVVAQTPGANNQVENRMFYFTESEGKIYRVATKAPENNSEKLAEESEKVINSLRANRPVQPQVASNRAVIKDEKDKEDE